MSEPTWKTILFGLLFGMGFTIGTGLIRLVIGWAAQAVGASGNF